MVAVGTPPHEERLRHGHDHDIAVSAVSELRSVLPFDAVQLLRHEPRRSEIREVLRIGYDPASAWALQHLFVQKYRLGFTRALSPDDGLPPAISSVRPEFRDDFVESSIFRDHLRAGGYRDGMSMELFLRGEYVGIAHFSARQSPSFTEESRRAAASVRGLLAALVMERRGGPLEPDAEARPGWVWYAFPGSPGAAPLSAGQADAPAFLESPAFHEHLEQFRATGLQSTRHLWASDRRLFQVEIRVLADPREILVGVAPAEPSDHHRLSLQELRVLSLLCAGNDDAAIGRRLQLSRRTVESHLLNARRKLGASNRVEAAVRAIVTASYLPDPVLCPVHSVLRTFAAPSAPAS